MLKIERLMAATFRLMKRSNCVEDRYFVPVTSLENFKDVPGIYILCIPAIRQYYIGQTSKSICERIKQHFSLRTKMTEFETHVGPTDIENIYVLPCKKYCDEIECNCIASIPAKYLQSVLPGGQEIGWIQSTTYDPSEFKYSLRGKQIIMRELEQYQKKSKFCNEF